MSEVKDLQDGPVPKGQTDVELTTTLNDNGDLMFNA